ncbi:MAG: hypothetical protein JRG84_15955 [Deltaproteobacteria bacterium]|nr:hypothetical protein [Deltaproteobacteria bacterium]
MSDYVVGVANVIGGVFCHALINGKINPSEANLEFWSNWRDRHPTFSNYGPPFFVAFGVLRIALGLLG